jgi:hypothetical protein
MESFTSNGIFILGLTLVIGWLLGLLSRSGGGKWKAAYNRERDAHLALRRDHDALLKQHVVVNSAQPQVVDPVRTGAF